jgi:acetyl-CoA carboxylase biotin carboxylase subunit
VLIANRGEIALRVVRACRTVGVGAVVATSTADLDSLAARSADRALCIGPPSAAASYLKVAAVVTAAQMGGCDAIHPGYGFLAESPELADACVEEGLTFVGPSARLLRLFGSKVSAREAARAAGVPLSAGTEELADAQAARAAADELGYPVLIKPVRGGGGKGMRVVSAAEEMEAAFALARQEAIAAFGDSALYLERWVARARHVEVQVAGDGTGTVLHFGDRDCSVQRRQQKLVEEAPAPALPAALQDAIRESAVALCSSVRYNSVGTVEFLVDVDRGDYFFLEVNPRIQVEHGVTELVTGIDLVALQLRLAAGEPLPWTQDEVRIEGAAIECRVNAEDPDLGFRPSPGRITGWHPPTGAGVRVDSHCEQGYLVPPFYDSLIAKVMAVAADREAAITRLEGALAEFRCEGIATTTTLVGRILAEPDFHAVRHHTKWLDTLPQPKE